MREKILSLLSSGNWVSGEDICNRLGITRAAVWKHIQALLSLGFDIETQRGKGYKLNNDNLSEDAIKSGLTTKWAGRHIHVLPVIDSTNNEVRRLAKQGAEHGTLVIAHTQTGGKGRLGRHWVSQNGGIWMTLLLRPNLPPSLSPRIMCAASLSLAMAIKNICNIEAKIKWPNDIVANGKKICGILLELGANADSIEWLCIGMGVNVNQTQESFDDEIKSTATSLQIIAGKQEGRAGIIQSFLTEFEKYYEYCFNEESFALLLEEIKQISATLGMQVKVITQNGEYEAFAADIDQTGSLIVKADGQYKTIHAGDVSVRGLMGYTGEENA